MSKEAELLAIENSQVKPQRSCLPFKGAPKLKKVGLISGSSLRTSPAVPKWDYLESRGDVNALNLTFSLLFIG
jgi:hypothetical protein